LVADDYEGGPLTETRPPQTAPERPEALTQGKVEPSRSTRRRFRPLLWFVAIPVGIALVVGSAGAVVVWRIQSSIDHKIERFGDPFKNIPATERPAAATTAMNLLVFGSDSRISAGDPSQWEAGAQRTDAIMLVHIPADRSAAYVVSIPRDSWVDVPGHGKAKINAAFSWGGPALAIRTVEQLTGVKIDHMVVTDFTGFARITDLLGGVTITVPKTTHIGNGDQTISAGKHKLDGQTALGYVRERYTLPHGDFDRVRRQQNWIRAIARSAASSGIAKDPQRLMSLIDALATNVSTDDEFTVAAMRDLALSLRDVGPGGARFLTVPVLGTGWSPDGKQSIVKLDPVADKHLWTAIAHDDMTSWLKAHPSALLGEKVS
jgi:LCP family protein required for cell wall assembly